MKNILKRSLSLLLAITIIMGSAYVGFAEVDFGSLFAVRAKAASVVNSGTCGSNLTWSLDDEGTLTISGTGAMTNYSYSNSAPWYSVRTNITSVVIDSAVTSIGKYAFQSCTSLTSITIPNSVTSIGSDAFHSCKSLTSITIPNSVTSIGSWAFNGCENLNAVYITDIAKWCGITFSNSYSNPLCYANNLYLNGKLVTDLVIPYGVTRIPVYGFSCTSLTSITIPDSITSIGERAFWGCTSLTSITIPDSVTSISYGAFAYCESLTSITIPNNVTSIGDYAFYDCTSLNAVYITDIASWCGITFASFSANPLWNGAKLYLNGELVTNLIIPNSVTSIGDSAFAYCESLTSITIPDSVTSIGSGAFYNCTSLASITIPDSVTSIGVEAFKNCTSLTSVTIPDSVTSIGDYAFYGCTSLTSITIPNSVTSIGYKAFYNCTSLTSITIPNSVTSIGSYAFYDCPNLTSVFTTDIASWCGITFASSSANPLCNGAKLYLNGELVTNLIIPDSVTSIGDDAFFNCTSLTSITIPDGVTSIGDGAFDNCTSLTSITIPDSVTSIGYWAFYNCTSLTSITIPDSVTSIDYWAFYNCTSLTSITIPNSVTSIGDKAFYNCTSLTSITIPDSVTSIGVEAFKNCTSLTSVTIPDSVTSIGDYAFYGCTSLTSITIPNSVTSIGYKAFYNCTSLTSITIPNSVTSIGYEAFYNCTSLTSITIPNSVTSIGSEAFYKCTNLTSITIPNSVTSIGSDAFYNCTSLTSITIPNSVTSIGSWAFYNCTSLKHVYYQGTQEQWKKISIGSYNGPLTSANIHYCSAGVSSTKLTDSDSILFILRDKQPFAEGEVNGIVSGECNISVSGGQVSYNGTTQKLSTDNFHISKTDLNTGITVTAPGYYTYLIPSTVIPSWKDGSLKDFTIYMSKDRNDGKTYISTVFARNCGEDDKQYIDVTTDDLNLLDGVKTDVVVTAIQQDSPVKEYYLSQDEKHKISDADGIFSAVDLYSKFDENKPVYAYAMLKNGKTTEPVSVSFKKKVMSSTAAVFLNSCNSGTVSLLGSDGFKITLSDDIPIVGGASITTGMASIPVGVEIQNERVRISIGVDIFSNEINGKSDTEWLNFKDACNSINKSVDKATDKMKTYRNLMTAKGFGTVVQDPVKKKNFDGSFLGYIEAYIIDGEVVFKEVSGTVALEFFFNYKQQFLVAGIPAIYAYVKAGAETSAKVTSGRAIPDRNLPFEFDVEANLTPSVKIGGGAGVKDAVSAGVWGKGSMPTSYNFTDTHLTLGLKGEIGLEAEFFMLKGDVTLLDGSVNLIDHYFNSSKTSLSGQSDALYSGNAVDVFEDGEVSLADRSYLANTSEWLGGQSASPYSLRRTIAPESVKISDLQTSVYKNSQTQLVQFGDTMLMAWIEDCADRDDYNRMRLVYSVYDIGTGLWSAPKAVADNGKCDSAPSLATDGENVYIAWQNIDYTVSTADKETVDIIMENAEIRLAKYNPQTNAFENVKTITNNSTYDYAPKATVNNGVAEVYWVNSASADFQKGTLSIQKSDFNGSTSTVLSGLNYVHCVDSNGTDVSYTMDKDGDTSTTTDIKVYTNSEQVSVDYEGVDTSCLYSTYAMLDGKKTLFYVDDYNLCYIQNGEEKVVFDSPRSINGNLQVCSDGTKTTAMWLEAGEMGTELYTCTYENGEWSSPVQLTNLSKVLSNVALTYFEGKIYGVFNRTHLEEVTSQVDGSIYYKNGTTDLCQLTTEGFTDISLSLIDIDESLFIPGSDVKFTVLAENNGTEKITNVSFEVTDGNGYARTIEKTVDLASGDAEFIELTYTVPEIISQTELSVCAIVNADTDESDNTASINIGTPDLEIGELKVQFVEGVYIVSGIVTNNNSVAANDVVVNAYLGEATEDNLFVSNIGAIEPYGCSKIEFMIDGFLLNFSENSYYDVTLKVASSGEERITYNNESVTVISETGIHNHSYSDWVTEKEATCTEDGSRYKECSGCGDKVTETITAKGHIYSEAWTVDKTATCTEDGSKSHHCTGCDDKKDVTVIKASGHNSSDWIIDTQATASAPGSKHKECHDCGETLETATIPQLKPATPKVTTTNEIGGVQVKWNAVAGATKYNVYRRQGGYKTWTLVGTTTGTTLLDKNVKSGIYYVYSVRAYNSAGQYSDFVTANTQTRKFMATPKLTGISNATNGLYIKWNAVAGITKGYRVYRRGAGSTYWTYLGTTKNLYFTDTQVKNKSGEYFRYTVIADGGYHSKFDTTGLYLRRLANPTLNSAVSSRSGITVKWGAVRGTTGYYVYRKTANSTWVRIAAVGGTNNTTFLDKTAKKGTTYTYTVRAVCGKVTSSYYSGISCKDKY